MVSQLGVTPECDQAPDPRFKIGQRIISKTVLVQSKNIEVGDEEGYHHLLTSTMKTKRETKGSNH
jgi:hypothetical protein